MTQLDTLRQRVGEFAYSQQVYELGGALVEHGVGLKHIAWDADDVLWDWLMHGRLLMKHLPRLLLRKDLGHHEWLQMRPGIGALLLGMYDQSVAQGDPDPFMRIWTNGYAWRLWKVHGAAPWLGELIGTTTHDHDDFIHHDRMFYRGDYATAFRAMKQTPQSLDAMPELTADLIRRHLVESPFDTSLKLPELATLVGKSGFEHTCILIDDTKHNVTRFCETGRVGFRVDTHAPKILRRRIPNSVWRRPERIITSLASDIVLQLAEACLELARQHGSPTQWPSAWHNVTPTRLLEPSEYDTETFELSVPNAAIFSEWQAPVDAIKREFRR